MPWDDAVAGSQGAVYWLGTDNKFFEVAKDQLRDEARQAFRFAVAAGDPGCG